MKTDKENLQLNGLVKELNISLIAPHFNGALIYKQQLQFNHSGYLLSNTGKSFNYDAVEDESFGIMDYDLPDLFDSKLYDSPEPMYIELNELSQITFQIEKFTDRNNIHDEYGRLSQCLFYLNQELIKNIEIDYFEDTYRIINFYERDGEVCYKWSFRYNENYKLEHAFLTNEGDLIYAWEFNYIEKLINCINVVDEENNLISKTDYHYLKDGWLYEIVVEKDKRKHVITFYQPKKEGSYSYVIMNTPGKVVETEEFIPKGELIVHSQSIDCELVPATEDTCINSRKYSEEVSDSYGNWIKRKVTIGYWDFIEVREIVYYELNEVDYLKLKASYQNKDIRQIIEQSYILKSDKTYNVCQKEVIKYNDDGNIVYQAVLKNDELISEIRKQYDNKLRVIIEEGKINKEWYKYRFLYDDEKNIIQRGTHTDPRNVTVYPCEYRQFDNGFRIRTLWPDGDEHSYLKKYDSFGNIIEERSHHQPFVYCEYDPPEGPSKDEVHFYTYNDLNKLVRHRIAINHSFVSDELYFYDKKGFLVKRIFKKFKPAKENKEFEYTYELIDENGNWLIRKERDETANIKICIRNIEYTSKEQLTL